MALNNLFLPAILYRMVDSANKLQTRFFFRKVGDNTGNECSCKTKSIMTMIIMEEGNNVKTKPNSKHFSFGNPERTVTNLRGKNLFTTGFVGQFCRSHPRSRFSHGLSLGSVFKSISEHLELYSLYFNKGNLFISSISLPYSFLLLSFKSSTVFSKENERMAEYIPIKCNNAR